MKRSVLLLLLVVGSVSSALAQPCDPDGTGPAVLGGTGTDVIVGVLPNVSNWGNAGGYYAYSVGTTSCNIGTAELDWIAGTNMHPVIGQNLFRLKDGRFEHVGQSWLKHGFTALQNNACGCGCISSGTGSRLGVGCSDPYSSGLNGGQGSAGAKSEIADPANGGYSYPQILDPPNLDLTWRRLRVAAADMDPTQNAGALYFIEGQYITPDDAAAGNGNNNTSYRQVTVGTNTGNYPLSLTGPTVQTFPGIQAWKDQDAAVTLTNINTTEAAGSQPGLMILGHKVTDNGNGTWHYEYALYNMNSTRGAASFSLPIGIGINLTNIEFHAPEYHSNEVYVNDAWVTTQAACALTWEVAAQVAPDTENGLFWGTLYNFRFDADVAPTSGAATIEYYVPGTVNSTNVTTQVPSGVVGSASPPVSNLSCLNAGQSVQLAWTNPVAYNSIEIYKNEVLLTTALGTDIAYLNVGAGVGDHEYRVVGVVTGECSFAASCAATVLTPLSISYPNPLPPLINPLGDSLDVNVTELNGGVRQAGSQKMFYDAGAGFVEVPLAPQGGAAFVASFPAIPCGQGVSFYFQAQDTLGTTVLDPPGAPADTFAVLSAASVMTTAEDFEISDGGWTVGAPGDTANTGVWERGDPIGTSVQPEDDHTDPGTQCWFTGQHPGGGAGANDLDGGATTLLTAVNDLTAMTAPTIGYWRWYANNGNGSVDDTFVIDINDGLGWVNVETLGPAGPDSSGGWIYHEFVVSDLVTLTSTVQLRFIASDFGSGSIVEAAIDDFLIQDVECESDCNNNTVADSIDISMGTSQDCNANNVPDECEIAAGALDVNMNGIPDECEGSFFQRGDCNADGSFDLSDPVRHLGILFASEPLASCEDSCDTNDDGMSDIADPVASLNALFGLGGPPPSPVGVCGLDPTGDMLTCASFAPCP